MLRKDEKKAMTRIGVLAIGWPAGLDRFYEGKSRDGILSIIGWGLIFAGLMLWSPCHGYSYSNSVAGESMAKMNVNPLILLPLLGAAYGTILILRKGFRLLRQFENAED